MNRGLRNINCLRPESFPFFKFEWPVIHAGRQAEAMFRQGGFACPVTFVHGADLRHGDVAFIDKQQCVFRQIFEQGWGRLPAAPRQIARIVFNPVAASCCLDHFKIEGCALFKPLGFEQAAGPSSSVSRCFSSSFICLRPVAALVWVSRNVSLRKSARFLVQLISAP